MLEIASTRNKVETYRVVRGSNREDFLFARSHPSKPANQLRIEPKRIVFYAYFRYRTAPAAKDGSGYRSLATTVSFALVRDESQRDVLWSYEDLDTLLRDGIQADFDFAPPSDLSTGLAGWDLDYVRGRSANASGVKPFVNADWVCGTGQGDFRKGRYRIQFAADRMTPDDLRGIVGQLRSEQGASIELPIESIDIDARWYAEGCAVRDEMHQEMPNRASAKTDWKLRPNDDS